LTFRLILTRAEGRKIEITGILRLGGATHPGRRTGKLPRKRIETAKFSRMLEPSMKKTWKCWLGTVAAAMLGSTVMAQAPQYPGNGSDMLLGDEGAVRLGDPSGSATTSMGPGRFNTYEPISADEVWAEAPKAYQGAPPPGDESVGFASSASYNDTQYRVGRVNSDTYGVNGGYTSIGAFIPLSSDGQNMWFFDPRAIITDYGQGAANLGLGYRRYSYAMDRIFGASIWYDYDNGHRTDYSQIGVSLENLGRYFSTRFNANIPLSDSNDFTTAASFGTPFFQGNNIAYLYSFLREMPYQNYVAEAAAPVPFFGRYGWEWALSAYGLVANDSGARDAIGIGGRFEWQVSEDFFINTTITHDRIFQTNASVNFELTIPSGPQMRWLRPKRVHDKLLASVKRPYRVSTSTAGFSETRLFLDPNDGAPIVVAHIDPTAANGAASGSVTNPFGSIADYMADAGRANFDIIFVGGNAIANDDTDLNTTIELLDRQRLLGTGALADGTVHQFQALAVNGQTVFDLPGFANGTSNTGPNPFLSNSGAAGDPVVRINGNYTEVSGFQIDAGGTANGIATVDAALAPRTVDSFVVTNNSVQNAITAINILSNTTPGATGPTTMPPARSLGLNDNVGNISNNTIDGTVGTGVTNGIFVDHQGGADPLELRVSGNEVTGVTNVGIDVLASGGTIDGTATNNGFVNNTVTDSGVGIRATASGAGSTFITDVQGNDVSGSLDLADPLDPTVGAGMIFLAEAGGSMTVDTLISNNSSDNAGRGAAFVATGAGSTLVITPAASPQNNTFNDNGDDGLLLAALAGGTATANTLAGNTATGNGGDGIEVLSRGVGSTAQAGLIGNTISGNTLNGINALADGGTLNIQVGDASLGVPQTVVTGNTQNGINFETTTNGGTLNGVIENVAVTSNGQNGIRLAAAAGTNTVSIDGTPTANNSITGNADNGVAIVGTGTGTVNVASMTNNAITGNNENGVDVTLIDDSTANIFDFSGNTVTNAGMGIRVNASDTSEYLLQLGVTGATNGSNIITGNVDAGIGIESFDTAIGNVNIAFTDITATTDLGGTTDFLGDGFRAITNDNSRINSLFIGGSDPLNPDVNITGNEGRGVALETRIASAIIAPTIRNSVISNNGNDGIEINRLANSKIDDIAILNNTLSANAIDAIEFNLQGGRVDIDNAPAVLIIDALISDNVITGPTPTLAQGDGIAMNLFSDVLLNANIVDNSIIGMGNAGIIVRGRDDSNIDGIWTNNTIRNNGQNAGGLERDGINITLTERAQAGLNSAGFGVAPLPPNTQGLIIDASEISGSGRDGIRIQGGNAVAEAPDANILIQNNTATVADPLDGIYGNAGSGIHMISQGGTLLEETDMTVTVNNNTIRNNGQDGIFLQAGADFDGVADLGLVSGDATLVANNNLITRNGRHGVNLETEDNSAISVTMIDNTVSLNTQRGVSLWNRHNAFTNLFIDGSVNPVPSGGTNATSRIEQNGETGLWVRNDAQVMDTINTINLTLTDTAIVGNGTNTGAAPDDRNGVWIQTGTSSFGVIQADVQRNFMSGNGNIDFVTESFVSVPQALIPVVTPYFGTNATYREDPLARLALRFIGNAGDQIDVTRQGAFYNNADQFKSPEALFTSNTRRRNAQRISVDYPPGSPGDTSAAFFPVNRTVTTAAANVNAVVINADAAFGGQVPQGNGTFTGLGVIINGTVRNATYNTGNNTLTFDGPTASFAVGDPIVFVATNIAGVGASTFRTTESAVNINNAFTTVISDFGSTSPLDLGAPSVNNNPLFNGNTQDFGWETLDPNAPLYVFP